MLMSHVVRGETMYMEHLRSRSRGFPTGISESLARSNGQSAAAYLFESGFMMNESDRKALKRAAAGEAYEKIKGILGEVAFTHLSLRWGPRPH